MDKIAKHRKRFNRVVSLYSNMTIPEELHTDIYCEIDEYVMVAGRDIDTMTKEELNNDFKDYLSK